MRIGRRYKKRRDCNDIKKLASEINCDLRVLPSPPSLTVEESIAAQSGSSSCTSPSGSGNSMSWDEQEQRRISIVEVYKHMGSPPRESWGGKDGVVATLCRVFKNITRNTIRRTLDEYLCSFDNKKLHSFERKKRSFLGEYLIPKGSFYEQLVADSMESGNGMKKTTRLVNFELQKEGKQVVGISTVRQCHLRLNPVKIKVKKRPQGTNDPHTAWSKASFNFAKQMAICYGKLDPRVTADPPMPPPVVNEEEKDAADNNQQQPPANTVFGPEPLPDYFHPDKLVKLDRCQVAYWDETHRICDLKSSKASTARGINFVYRYPRDDDRALDPNGELKNTDPTELNVKYDQEVRLALGVFLYQHPSGEIEGRRIKPFSYTSQTILSEEEWQRKVQYEISRVKKLKGDSSGNKGQWTQKVRQGRIFEADRLSVLKGIGPTVESRISEQGYSEVRHILAIKNDETRQRDLVRNVKGLSYKMLTNLFEQLLNVHSGSCPPDIDHTTSNNPYRSLFNDA